MKIMALLSILILVAACSSKNVNKSPEVRSIQINEPTTFHSKVEIQVGWFPYQSKEVKKLDDNVWEIVKEDKDFSNGDMPVLIFSYPDSNRAIMLEMDTDNELLGRLLKQTLMTQQPIKTPLQDYLKETDCSTCHPSDVEMN